MANRRPARSTMVHWRRDDAGGSACVARETRKGDAGRPAAPPCGYPLADDGEHALRALSAPGTRIGTRVAQHEPEGPAEPGTRMGLDAIGDCNASDNMPREPSQFARVGQSLDEHPILRGYARARVKINPYRALIKPSACVDQQRPTMRCAPRPVFNVFVAPQHEPPPRVPQR